MYVHDLTLSKSEFKLRQSLDLGTPLTRWMEGIPLSYVVSLLDAMRTYPSVHADVEESLSAKTLLADLWLSHVLTSKCVPYWSVLHKPSSAVVIGSKFGQLVQFWMQSLNHVADFNFPTYVAEHDKVRATVARHTLKVSGVSQIRVWPHDLYLMHHQSPASNVIVWKDVHLREASAVKAWNRSLASGNILVVHGSDAKEGGNQLTSPLDLERYFHEGQILYAGQLEGGTETQFALAVIT